MNSASEERQLRARNLAREALRASQDKIVANMRFLDPAVYALRVREAGTARMDESGNVIREKNRTDGYEEYGLRTNGSELIYVPADILRRARKGLPELTHDYMHVLLHCIFRHYHLRGKVRKAEWDLAVDIAVEEVIDSFRISAFESERSPGMREELLRLRRDVGSLTAERIYRFLVDGSMLERRFERLSELFRVDHHDLWYEKDGLPLILDEDEDAEDADSGEQGDASDQEQPGEPDEDGEFGIGSDLETDQDWEQIAQMVKTAIEAGEGTDDAGSGKMLESLRKLGHKTMDYTTFLRKFASRRETLKVDDNSFDYIFYTYGLELYGDMPLVEPLEYSDEKQIRDLVIVIDSSASTEGELVQSFTERTFDILMTSEEFRTRFNIRLLQCDTQIQEDVQLRNRRDVEAYLKNIEIKGMGGTDFRTAFRYVDDLLATGAFTDLKGLIYFTDGKGTFPKHRPPYETAFVFDSEDSADRINVPPWAMKVAFDQ
ncbi:MAG: VWA domain-containing protein [Mogibacterium sp.]|nr:VWA domain-containing protein [Mogibacterium sp.]